MKTKRVFYYGAVLAGGILLIFSSGFKVPELAMAAGFALLMAGLYGLSRSNNTPDTEKEKGDG